VSTAPPTTPPSSVRALTCTQCGGSLSLRAAGYTVSMVCEHCGVTLDTTDPQLRIIAQATTAIRRPLIPLGTRGVLRGETWEVVGYLERSDGDDSWSEYLLFNPYRGYGWLIDDGRRFSYGFLLDSLPKIDGTRIVVDTGRGFDWDAGPYPVEVSFVVGEFYWRVAVGERVQVTDYARLGTMVSCEENDSERTWSKLELLDRGEAEQAFGMEPRRAYGGAPSPHEPSPWRDRLMESGIIGAIAAVTLLIIAAMGSGTQRLASVDTQAGVDGAPRTVVIHGIQVSGHSSAIHISAQSDQLDNDWVDLDYSLVDRRTQQSFDSYGLAEHYTGSDSDGPWSEGDTRPNTRLSSIPPGSYDLVVEVAAHRWAPNSSSSFFDGAKPVDPNPVLVPVTINVDRGGVFGGNVVFALILILIWPGIVLWRHFAFEKRRNGFDDDDGDD
jgi:hypothetical protein